MGPSPFRVRRALWVAPVLLAGCLGIVTIGGTVSGLEAGTSVTLRNNTDDDLTVSANGSFRFDEGLSEGDTYSVTVVTQPVGRTCTVSNGSGTIATGVEEITTVQVTCAMASSVAGTVTGLQAGTNLTLANGTSTLVVTADGAFAFPGVLAAGTAYAVTVAVQPPGRTCTVANGSGSVTDGVATRVAVTCS